MLKKELRFYDEHQSEWAALHPGKYVLLKGSQLVGVFETLNDALAEGARRFGLTPFLVRSVERESDTVHIPAMAAGVLHANPPPAV